MSFPFLIQGDNIVIVIDNVPHTINKTHIAYNNLKSAIKAQDWGTVKSLLTPKDAVREYGAGNVTIDGNQLFWNGQLMHGALSRKMIEMLDEGFSIDPLVNFMNNLMSNPSKRAVDELYGFLEVGNMPITPDGHFLAFKKVRSDYTDVHSGTISNHVGAVCEMARNAVDDDKNQTCSTGLHFCSQTYLTQFGGQRTMILKINPKDVVSIPTDYNNSKGRACRYEVIGELDASPSATFVKSVQANGFDIKPKQYFKNGNPLSTTKNAIKKRMARMQLKLDSQRA